MQALLGHLPSSAARSLPQTRGHAQYRRSHDPIRLSGAALTQNSLLFSPPLFLFLNEHKRFLGSPTPVQNLSPHMACPARHMGIPHATGSSHALLQRPTAVRSRLLSSSPSVRLIVRPAAARPGASAHRTRSWTRTAPRRPWPMQSTGPRPGQVPSHHGNPLYATLYRRTAPLPPPGTRAHTAQLRARTPIHRESPSRRPVRGVRRGACMRSSDGLGV